MSMLIVYATKYGCTEKCVELLSKKLEGKADICNLKSDKIPDLSQYDKVIAGGSVYIGKIRKEVNEFCSKNLGALKNKKIGLFICGMAEGDALTTEINNSFPQELISSASAKECFGGEFIFKKMNFMERAIIKKISKSDKDTSKILEGNIESFAEAMNKA